MLRAFNRHVFYNLTFFFFNQGSTFFANIAIARILGRETFGQFIMSMNTVVALATLAGLGMGYSATKFLAEYRDSNKSRAGEILGFCKVLSITAGLLGVILLVALSSPLSDGYLGAPELAPHLRLASVFVLLSSVNGCLVGVLSGFSSFRKLALVGAISGVFYLASSIGGAFYGGIDGALLGIVCAYLVQLAVLVRVSRLEADRHQITSTYSAVWKEGRLVRSWVIPSVLNGSTAVPTLWLMQSFLLKFTHGFQDIADYNAAYSFLVLLLVLPYVINSVGMPFINNLLGNGNDVDYKRFFWANTGVTLVTVSAGAFLLVLLGHPLLGLYGSGFVNAYSYLLIFLLASIPESLTIAVSQVLQSKGKAWMYFLGVNVPRDTTMLLCAFYWVQSHGPLGLCYAYFTGRLVGAVAVSVCTRIVGVDLHRPSEARLAPA